MYGIRKKIPIILLTLVMAGVLSLSAVSATLSPLTPPPTDGYDVGDILDPGCGPVDPDCLINPASFRGASYGNSVTTGHNNEGLYLNGSGNLTSDALFTRDSVTNHTNIMRDFGYSTNTVSVDVAPVLILNSVSGTFNDGDTILNTTDGTSTATIIKSLQGSHSGNAIILSSVSGVFNMGDTILNTTDGTSTGQAEVYSTPFSPGNSWYSFNIVTGTSGSSGGTIVSINGDTYDLGAVISGAVSQYDLLLDTVTGQPNSVVGVVSVSSISNSGSANTGFITDDNYANFGLQGSYLHQSDGVTSMDFGVFDLSALGGSRTSAGIVSVDQNTGASTTFIATPAGSAGSISFGVQSPTNQYTNFNINGGSFSLLSRGLYGNENGFGTDGNNLYFRSNGTNFTFPTSTPNPNDVLYVTGGSGQNFSLGWTAGGSSNPWLAYTIPSDGTNGQILSTNGSGVLGWIDAGGVLPDQTNHNGEFLTTNSGILSWTSNIGSYVPLSYMGTNNGVATLDANGKIPSSQLAALAINNSFIVNSEVDMLALVANTGDIAVRTDISSTFVLSGTDPTVLSDWVQLFWQPTVVSVNGQTGVVNLNTDTITEGSTNLYFTNSRVNTAITAYLPNQSGNSGRVLSTDGAGNLSWVVQTGGTGGSSPVLLDNNGNLYTGGIGAGQGQSGNIFFGFSAGNGATGASNSNFFGNSAGDSATNAIHSNFFGDHSGHDATDASYSNFFGSTAGYAATNANSSNFFGNAAGNQATNAAQSNFFGNAAGYTATNASNSNFFGYNAGYQATSAPNSNFFGNLSGYGATNANSSNFFGSSAGNSAINANDSNFFGTSAGLVATYASFSNFFGQSAGQAATDAYNSNFMGLLAGYAASGAHDANFFGDSAGYEATLAEYSNFFGDHAGYQATYASNSNFFGDHAGHVAQNASGSNFFGLNAGYQAINAHDSNFFGANAGYTATNATNANFIGVSAGVNATDAASANFFGYYAGYDATSASSSNFFGPSAGLSATNANDSNFFGTNAGKNATSASGSNFFGSQAGQNATSAPSSNFFGTQAGYGATNADNANFFGYSAGNGATNASSSNFFGYSAGNGATNASSSNFFGYSAGNGATSAGSSNFIGMNTGENATNAAYSNFIGWRSGYFATDASFANFIGYSAGDGATDAHDSNFMGVQTGKDATNASYSNFFGASAGYQAISAEYSNFLGANAGINATNANNANFFGRYAGSGATNAYIANFIGQNAGNGATNANQSNFIGYATGYNATAANNANFIGYTAGQYATNSAYANFFGYRSGYGAANAKNSIFIGQNAGYNDAVVNTSDVNDFSILIGKDTTTGGFSNSIAIGGSAANTTSNQFMIGSTTRPIDTTVWKGSSSTTCTVTTGTGIACSSDERLKTNVTDLTTDTLDKLLNLKTVTYNWVQNPDSPQQIGFIAQDLEQYFPQLVTTDSTGYKSVYYSQITPVLVEAIREMNVKVENLKILAPSPETTSFLIVLSNWLGDITNGIQKIFAHEVQTDKLCVGQTCVDEQQLQQLLQNQNIESTPPSNPTPPTVSDPGTNPPSDSNSPTVTPDPGSTDPAPVVSDPTSDPTPPPVTDTPPTE